MSTPAFPGSCPNRAESQPQIPGGIGENSPGARAGICQGLEFLGISLHSQRNVAGAPLITTDTARTPVRIV
jgi:acetate kinase